MEQNNEMMNYTSIEQSKHLLELGLNPESADMSWEKVTHNLEEEFSWEVFLGANPAIKMNTFSFRNGYVIPCWSVGALIEIIWKSLPSVMLIPGSRFDIEPQYWCTTGNEEIYHDTKYYASAIEALYDMICWLLFNGYIKTE